MKLKSVFLSNFKSFGGEVALEDLAEGVNILVGANGAGKSSILSGIRFVVDAHKKLGLAERRALINENSPELAAHVEIAFENRDRAFPGGDTVVVRRTITQKSDEYTLDGVSVPREELVSLYETAGISKSMPYFVVEQGKINELAQMGGASRMDMIRDLAGSSVYEQEKEESTRVLAESEETEAKIGALVVSLQAKAASAAEAKERRAQKNRLDSMRQVLVKEIYQRELHKIRMRIEQSAEDASFGDESAADQSEDALKAQLEDLLSQISVIRLDASDASSQRSPAEVAEDLRQATEALGREEAQAHLLQKEVNTLKTYRSFAEVAETEACSVQLLGEASVQSRVAEIRRQLADAPRTHPPPTGSAPVSAAHTSKEDVLEQRRDVWRRAQEVQRKKKRLEAHMKDQERAFLMGARGFALGSELRRLPGVVGYVYDLISMPWKILSALSVAGTHLLTTIVVRTREDGLALVRTHGITQPVVPLSGLPKRKGRPDISGSALSTYISSSEECASLVEYLFGRIYLVSDFEAARSFSRAHRVDVLTMGGEYFSASGAITGGEEKASHQFKQYAQAKEEYRVCFEEEQAIHKEKEASDKAYAALDTSPLSETPDYLKTLLFLLEHPGCDLNATILQKTLALEQARDFALAAHRNTISRLAKEQQEVSAKATLATLQASAAAVEKKLFRIIGSAQWKEKTSEKERQELKFRRLQKKILALNPDNTESIETVAGDRLELKTASNNTLITHLGKIKRAIEALPLELESAEQIAEEYAKMEKKLKDLKRAKHRILEMQEKLEAKKEDVINITVSQVKSNFEHFFHKLTQGSAAMAPRTTPAGMSLDIKASFSGEPQVASEELSSGQKTIIALCIILSIQKIYEAPFYLMDEFDANLDGRFLQAIVDTQVLRGRQMVLCTFRDETLSLADKRFYVHNRQVSDTPPDFQPATFHMS